MREQSGRTLFLCGATTRSEWDTTRFDAWKNLVRRRIADIAEAQKISQQNIRWYAAFHNNENNPHVHIVVYSSNPKEGFLTQKGIEKIRSSFANDIYRGELQNLYSEHTVIQNKLRADTRKNLVKKRHEII